MRTRLLLLIVAIAPSLALAQTKELKDKPQSTFNEIERGFYLGITAGFWSLINPPANKQFTTMGGMVIQNTSAQPFSSVSAVSTASSWPRIRRILLMSFFFSRVVCIVRRALNSIPR